MIVFFETSIPDLAKSLVSDLAVDSSDTSFIGFFLVFEIFSFPTSYRLVLYCVTHKTSLKFLYCE